MTNTNDLTELLKMNNNIGDNVNSIVSLSKIAIRELSKSFENENATKLYDVIALLRVILEKSLQDENDSAELGCCLEKLQRKTELISQGYQVANWCGIDWAYKEVK
ncbi:hypothetical protein BGL37_01440 [Fructilactobacillus sanfranciscensis]|uniref:hypothetical protein n=1 Tax=Fructilactobacillus sanfranciscensis TaxID=1625 RepID=UPI000CD44135|nr:hypothetical protein [Fructilactobacillus sanfranciscensis]MCG7194741.1 hypothetical protein [Fructilactobacillus sanfranciscensis]MDN4462408.1 hypothetical protein [Fructilactobacillus sanfranciscensis]NDR61392.1 hypothetical protein [Fructilactobacillus sanfranciscensis]POH10613.1 hypothetical protein BGL37_01440 [Fructilactobacillus sanfranciscensis]POH14916.1 hypothetical protein BGL42_01440 [Fructilactobacillus sanfranciscensis]